MEHVSASQRRLRVVSGVSAAVLGTLATGALLAVMNGAVEAPRSEKAELVVQMDAAPKKKPPPKPKPKPKPKPRRSTPPPPMPAIGAGLSGMSFGIPGLSGALDQAADALLGDVGDVVMTEEAVDTPPRPMATVQPEYPTRARKNNIQGTVVLSLLIGADGSVQDVRVLEADPPGVFEEVAMAAVRQWRFSPAMYEGRPVAMRARQPLDFVLE